MKLAFCSGKFVSPHVLIDLKKSVVNKGLDFFFWLTAKAERLYLLFV